jgi:hypothetical protein
MKFRVLLAGAFVCLAATACGTVSHASVKAGTTSVSHATGGGQTATVSAVEHAATKSVAFECLTQTVVRPTSYILTCADAGSVLAHMSWLSWTAKQGVATGVHQLNDCTPNCAEGTFISYPAVITFWRPEPVAGHSGETYFTRVTVRYTTGKRPPMYMNYNQLVKSPAQWTEVLGS